MSLGCVCENSENSATVHTFRRKALVASSQILTSYSHDVLKESWRSNRTMRSLEVYAVAASRFHDLDACVWLASRLGLSDGRRAEVGSALQALSVQLLLRKLRQHSIERGQIDCRRRLTSVARSVLKHNPSAVVVTLQRFPE
mmetsp:Transcript_17683/g.55362  ORF Transcript_17683/g.55362 Transcript_17683/m.55362 type:complete len:142 (+) Transcript_17683:2429-2854(+)